MGGTTLAAAPTAFGALQYGLHVDPVPPFTSQGIGNDGEGDLTLPRAQLLYSGGMRWIRLNVDWGDVQPNNATEANWAKVDKNFDNAKAAGLKVLLVVSGRPCWADPDLNCATELPAPRGKYPISQTGRNNFAQFINQLTDHYKGRYSSDQVIKGIEIWNEVNLSRNTFYSTTAQATQNAQEYAKLVKVATPYIRAQAPQAKIVAGALNAHDNKSLNFIDAFYDVSGITTAMDIFSVHPYSNTEPSEASSSGCSTNQNGARCVNTTLIDRIHASGNDPSERIWVTEFGLASSQYPAGPWKPDGDTQGGFIESMTRHFKDTSITDNQDVIFGYTLQDNQGDGSQGKWTDLAGFFTQSGLQKPAWTRYSCHALGGSSC